MRRPAHTRAHSAVAPSRVAGTPVVFVAGSPSSTGGALSDTLTVTTLSWASGDSLATATYPHPDAGALFDLSEVRGH